MYIHIFSLILLLHIGCFSSTSSSSRRFSTSQFRNKLLSNTKTASVISFLKRIFSPSSSSPPPPPSVASPSSSTRSIIPLAPTHDKPSNNHPCSVSELADGENIVRIIFKMGWPEKANTPTIQKILKINNGPKTLARFEEYREGVKSRAAAKAKNDLTDGRCAADGNELLRFYCTTFTCELVTSICGQHYCSACGIIRSGFSRKMDGISTMSTSWKAHGVLPEDLEEEFSFMDVKRALLVCRVVAGQVGCDPDGDSVVGGIEDELVVFNPWAVLPCFVIVYTL